MIGPFLKAWAETKLAIQAIIGAGHAMRLSPAESARKAGLPRVVYRRVYGDRIKKLAGTTGLRRSVYDVEFQARTRAEADQLAELFVGDPDLGVEGLDGYSGTLAGIVMQGAHFDNETEIFESGPDQPGGANVFCVIHSYVFWWQRAAI